MVILSPQISTSVTVPCMVVLNCASTNQEDLSVPVTLVTSSSIIHNVEVSGSAISVANTLDG